MTMDKQLIRAMGEKLTTAREELVEVTAKTDAAADVMSVYSTRVTTLRNLIHHLEEVILILVDKPEPPKS